MKSLLSIAVTEWALHSKENLITQTSTETLSVKKAGMFPRWKMTHEYKSPQAYFD